MIKKLPKSLRLLQTKYTPDANFGAQALKVATTTLSYPNKGLTSRELLNQLCGTVIVIEMGNKPERQLNNFGEDKKMKKNILRGWIPTVGLVLAMAFNTFANGGIVVQGASGSDAKGSCTAKVDSGIIVQGFGGMLVSDLIGILVSDFTKAVVCGEKVDSGIIVQGFGGMLVSD